MGNQQVGSEKKVSDPNSRARLAEPPKKKNAETTQAIDLSNPRHHHLWETLSIHSLMATAKQRVEQMQESGNNPGFDPWGKTREEIMYFLKTHPAEQREPSKAPFAVQKLFELAKKKK